MVDMSKMSFKEVKKEIMEDDSVHSVVKTMVEMMEKKDVVDFKHDLKLITKINDKYCSQYGF